MVALVNIPGFRVTDSNGDLVAGAKLYAYLTGTTTPVTLYLDSALSSPTTNPAIANASGLFPDLYAATTPIRVELKTSSGTEIADVDPYLSGGLVLAVNTYIIQATGGTPRQLLDKLGDIIHIKDFGGVGDGVTDDTTAITNALAYLNTRGAGTLRFGTGVYLHTTQISIAKPIRLIGEGPSWYAYNDFAASVGTTLKYNGTISGTQLTFLGVNNGAGLRDLLLDGNAKADICLNIDGSINGIYKNVSIRNPINTGLKLTANGNRTCSWNTFTNLSVEVLTGTKGGLWLTVGNALGNACHNTFIGTRIIIGGAQNGIRLGGCDNNAFYMTYIYDAVGATGRGVLIDPAEAAGFPVNNTFYHLQASTRGYLQPAGASAVTAGPVTHIYGYMRDNGQPAPSVSGGVLDCADAVQPITVATSTGWSGGAPTFDAKYIRVGNLVTVFIYLTGAAVVAAANALITGLPAVGSSGQGLMSGVNTGAGGDLRGYITGTTLLIQSGIASTASASMVCTYIAA